MLRNNSGYIDPSAGIFLLAITGIILLGPYLFKMIQTGLQANCTWLIKMIIVGLIVTGVQVVVIVFAIYEAYWDTLKGGSCSGPLDRPPLLKGQRGTALAVICYGVGCMRLIKDVPPLTWGAVAYGGMALGLIITSLFAFIFGKKRRGHGLTLDKPDMDILNHIF